MTDVLYFLGMAAYIVGPIGLCVCVLLSLHILEKQRDWYRRRDERQD